MDLRTAGGRRRPPIVKGTRFSSDFYLDEDTFERCLGLPAKIHIPQRYSDVDDEEEVQQDPEEELKRARKAEAICRLLAKSGGPTQSLLIAPHIPSSKPRGTSRGAVGTVGSRSSSGFWSETSSRQSVSIGSPQSLPVSPFRRHLIPAAKRPSDSLVNRQASSPSQ